MEHKVMALFIETKEQRDYLMDISTHSVSIIQKLLKHIHYRENWYQAEVYRYVYSYHGAFQQGEKIMRAESVAPYITVDDKSLLVPETKHGEYVHKWFLLEEYFEKDSPNLDEVPVYKHLTKVLGAKRVEVVCHYVV